MPIESKGVLLCPGLIVGCFFVLCGDAIQRSIPAQPRVFSDCERCPDLVRIPAGRFQQGDLQGTGDDDEKPTRQVIFSMPFAVSRSEVTYQDWDACVAEDRCERLPEEDLDEALRPELPVQNVSWNDTQDFVDWLSSLSGKKYRLLSESEFEYVARAGTSTRYPWGDSPSRNHANYGFDECCGGAAVDHDRWIGTAPVRSFPDNGFGVFDMAGNVQEWVQDCWVESYADASSDGSANTEQGDCEWRGLRGGSWSSTPKMIRPANRDKGARDARLPYYGFRVARDL